MTLAMRRNGFYGPYLAPRSRPIGDAPAWRRVHDDAVRRREESEQANDTRPQSHRKGDGHGGQRSRQKRKARRRRRRAPNND